MNCILCIPGICSTAVVQGCNGKSSHDVQIGCLRFDGKRCHNSRRSSVGIGTRDGPSCRVIVDATPSPPPKITKGYLSRVYFRQLAYQDAPMLFCVLLCMPWYGFELLCFPA